MTRIVPFPLGALNPAPVPLATLSECYITINVKCSFYISVIHGTISNTDVTKLSPGGPTSPKKFAKVIVEQIFKGATDLPNPGSTVVIAIPDGQLLRFEKGKSYLISGKINKRGSLLSTDCDWNVLWNTVTKAQLWGLKYIYHRYCQCNISYCGRKNADDCFRNSNMDCVWNVDDISHLMKRSDCHSTTNICLYSVASNECHWRTPICDSL